MSPELIRAAQLTQTALHGLSALAAVANLRDFMTAHDLSAELTAAAATNPNQVIYGGMTAKRMLESLQLANHIDAAAFGTPAAGEPLPHQDALTLRNRLIA